MFWLDGEKDFLELLEYLSSWVKTKDGKYEPVDTTNIKSIIVQLFFDGSEDIIKSFKDGVNSGRILMSTYCIGLFDEKRQELYEKNKKIVDDYEKKHNIK